MFHAIHKLSPDFHDDRVDCGWIDNMRLVHGSGSGSRMKPRIDWCTVESYNAKIQVLYYILRYLSRGNRSNLDGVKQEC
jgi:hypothetical protein